ncbi:MAG: type II toxin-antitoxin system RelE/ParE family toxin, partial [Gammaproteobacteria bacterium]|nr:type II toxin-antitoxin system RelE/ParE family toxin [Gammaproteobacteria bacterium]
MLTVIETPTFQKQVAKVWTLEERHAFIDWIAANHETGDVIPGGGGMRKVRWMVAGKGKRGGARVIYITFLEAGELALLSVYTKAERENMLPSEVKRS